ncbi:MAG: hypothetical protein QOE55_1574 [Acidobacteriaceae bacterium]|nr:hypothetical protein [Acidobacteriaceae bacterium]
MKLQDVILKAMAKKISWLEAAEIIGVCDRTMRRMRERYQEFGYDGLFDQRRRKRTTMRVPMQTAERVLTLYQETYFDLSVRHFHEKLQEDHAIELSYTWVKQALQGAGLVARRKKRGSHRRRRARRPLPGMLLHIDGSKHRWFSDDRCHDLLVILDDAIRPRISKGTSMRYWFRRSYGATLVAVTSQHISAAESAEQGSGKRWGLPCGEAVACGGAEF